MTDQLRRDPNVEAWLASRELTPPATEHADWGLKVQLSTVPLDMWIARKSKIPGTAAWFGLNVHRLLGVAATLVRADEKLKLSWRLGALPSIESESFIYRVRTAWPLLESLELLQPFLASLEEELKVKFVPHAELTAYSLQAKDFETLRQWLAPVANTIDIRAGAVRDAVPHELAVKLVPGRAGLYRFTSQLGDLN